MNGMIEEVRTGFIAKTVTNRHHSKSISAFSPRSLRSLRFKKEIAATAIQNAAPRPNFISLFRVVAPSRFRDSICDLRILVVGRFASSF